MSQTYREGIIEQLSKIDDEILEIIKCCDSGNYSMNEIISKLEELKEKIY